MSRAAGNGAGKAAPAFLSERLRTVFSLVPPSDLAADIGCDHGQLAIALVEAGTARRAVASDLRMGPLSRAEEAVRAAGLADRIDCRLGDGLSALAPGEADTVIIAGMGGLLMKRILAAGREVLESVKTLVLSPHRDVPEIRAFLPEAGFRITEEKICSDAGKYYFVLKAVREAQAEACGTVEGPAAEALPGMTEKTRLEKEFGLLIYGEDPVFLAWLREEQEKADALIRKLGSTPSADGENEERGLSGARMEALKRIRARRLDLGKAEAMIRRT